MGGELASLVTVMLEDEPWVGAIHGMDVEPPRRRFRRATFELVEPDDEARMAEITARFDPHVLMHLGVYEPGARAGDGAAQRWTESTSHSVLTTAGSGPALESIVVRSGLAVYGTRR